MEKESIYLFNFTHSELIELYKALILREELNRRLRSMQGEELDSELVLLQKIANQFTERFAQKLREETLENLDDFIDHQIDDELMWQGIEEQLRNKLDE